MSDPDEPPVSDQEALELGSAALFSAIGEGAKVVVPAVAASAGWQAMLAVTLPLLGLAVAKGAHGLFPARTVLLAKGYTKAFNDDPAKVADHAKAHEHDADYHETMYRTFRAMMDAAEPEVVETLGYLAGPTRTAESSVSMPSLGRTRPSVPPTGTGTEREPTPAWEREKRAR